MKTEPKSETAVVPSLICEAEKRVANAIERTQKEAVSAVLHKDRSAVDDALDRLAEWRRIRDEYVLLFSRHQGLEGLSFVITSWILWELIQKLTEDDRESACYLTGEEVNGVKIISRICEFEIEDRSVVHAKGNLQSCGDTLFDIIDRGLTLHAMAHSHPGCGPDSVRESAIDVNYLGPIQKAGADVIGIIVSRDGHVRFFSVEKEFQISIQGTGVTHVGENIYKIEMPQDQDQSIQVS